MQRTRGKRAPLNITLEGNDSERMSKGPRPLSLVKLKPELLARARSDELPFVTDTPLVFLGEIPNMPEHGVFVGYSSGRVYSGYPIDQFVELSDDEV